jgi:CBS domain-containing protein
VEDVMTKDVITIGKNYPVKYAESLMNYFSIEFLIVMDVDRPTGIITMEDIRSRINEKGLDPHIVNVCEAMSSPLIYVLKGTAINKAVDLMLQHEIMRLPIIEDSQLIGLLTRVNMSALSYSK